MHMFGLRPESLGVLVLALIGITAALMAFIKTPAEQRFRWRPGTLEQQRDACTQEVQAVIIKGDWRRALKREAVWLPAILLLAAFAFWFDLTKGVDCATLFGASRIEIAMAMLFYGFPVLMFLGSLFGVRAGQRLLQGGHWPPLDRVPFVDTLAKKGRAAQLRGWVLCVMPILLFGFALFAHFTFVQLLAGRTYSEVLARMESSCQVLPPK